MKYFESKEAFDAASGAEIQDKLKEFTERYDSKFLEYDEWLDSYEIDYYSETIELETSVSSGCGCCSDSRDHHYIPLSHLWKENWEEDEQKSRDSANAAQKRLDEKRREAEAVKFKERRYKRYLELQKEFAE